MIRSDIYDHKVQINGQKISDLENWDAVALGFFISMGEGEVRDLKHRDILLGVDNGRPYVTLFIRQSKTDQEKGVFRTLYGIPPVLCHVKAVSAFISTKRGRYGELGDLFSANITIRVQNLLKLAA